MPLASTSWDLVGAAIIWLLGVAVCLKAGRTFGVGPRRAFLLYCWHSLFCVVYIFYVARFGGDALAYYRTSLSDDLQFSLGTDAVRCITWIFSSLLDLSILGAYLAFNIFGTIGLLSFDASLRAATAISQRSVRQLATLIVFLPSVSFWSSAIGKDALSFMAAGLALWSAQDLRRRSWVMFLGIATMLLVRPHIASLMVLALAVAMTIRPGVSMVRRITVGVVAVGAALMVIPFAMDYSGLGSDADVSDFESYVELRQGYNMTGGGAIDISAMPLPLKLFTYLFRPLPFEASSITALAASIDNVVLMVLVLLGARALLLGRKPADTASRTFMWFYAISAWIILALATSNMGISLRQKWMFAPMLICLFISVIGKKKVAHLAIHRPTS